VIAARAPLGRALVVPRRSGPCPPSSPIYRPTRHRPAAGAGPPIEWDPRGAARGSNSHRAAHELAGSKGPGPVVKASAARRTPDGTPIAKATRQRIGSAVLAPYAHETTPKAHASAPGGGARVPPELIPETPTLLPTRAFVPSANHIRIKQTNTATRWHTYRLHTRWSSAKLFQTQRRSREWPLDLESRSAEAKLFQVCWGARAEGSRRVREMTGGGRAGARAAPHPTGPP
jgi:hypothetical protein